MGTLTVKLPQPLQAQLDALVARRGQRKSDVVREAIERLVAEPKAPRSTSVLDLLKDLKGSGRGPKDLSSNPKHLQDYGR
jgi:Arc/MetJ-type ribon-helix-helix transcriptional regulator